MSTTRLPLLPLALLMASLAGAAAAAEAQVTPALPAAYVSLPDSAPLPPPRPEVLAAAPRNAPGDFRNFLAELERDAIARGHEARLVRDVIRTLQPARSVMSQVNRQSEFVKPIWTYLDDALSRARVRQGLTARRNHRDTLREISEETGVDASVLLGIWGMETSFGGYMGNQNTFQALATLAHASHRRDYFRDEFMAALTLVERGKIRQTRMRGSWAGAIGHTQFMPSNILKYCVDGDGDGICDLMGSAPDALASSAAYLVAHGWQAGLPWGFEVTLPRGFDFMLDAGDAEAWQAEGVRRADGAAIDTPGDLSLLLPAGANGPAFLVTGNFDVVKRYNPSEAYALGVVYLGELVSGRSGVTASWPRGTKMLPLAQRREIQETLQTLGYYDGPLNGNIGPMTRGALRDFQRAHDLRADGFADQAVLTSLRQARAAQSVQRDRE